MRWLSLVAAVAAINFFSWAVTQGLHTVIAAVLAGFACIPMFILWSHDEDL